MQLLPGDVTPTLGGRGTGLSTGPVYESRYVELVTKQHGTLAVWLFAVLAGHRYNDSRLRDRLGAGLMRDADTVLAQSALGPRSLQPPGGFKWRKPGPEWESYLLYIDAHPDADPSDEGQRLAEAALGGLRRAKLLA